jgi:ankyrin repeat protein
VLENKKKIESLQIMTVLLDRYPKLMNSTANLNTSILVAALEKNKPEIVKLLIERGADPNQATSDKGNQRRYSQRRHPCISLLGYSTKQSQRRCIGILFGSC